jgi:hypothetical protein
VVSTARQASEVIWILSAFFEFFFVVSLRSAVGYLFRGIDPTLMLQESLKRANAIQAVFIIFALLGTSLHLLAFMQHVRVKFRG